MTVKCLSHFDQLEIVRLTTQEKVSQTDLAEDFHVSRRTIQRVLLNFGVIHYNERPPAPKPAQENSLFHRGSQQKMDLKTQIPPSTRQLRQFNDDDAMVRMLREKGHTPTTLKQLMDKPTLSRRNVELYLTRLPEDELAKLTYVIGLVRIKMQDRTAAEQNKQREAANG